MGLKKKCISCDNVIELHEKEPKYFKAILAVCSQDCLEKALKNGTPVIIDDPYYKKVPLKCLKKYMELGYRSNLELQFAQWLTEKGIPFEYEKYYAKPNFKYYLPDFLIPSFGWIELKGVWQQGAWAKFSKFKEDIEKLRIGVVYVIPSYILRRIGIYG